MVNRVIIMGRIGNDLELKYTPSNTAVLNLSIATSEKFHDREGNKQEKTEWHRVVAFGKQAEIISQYAGKGSKLFIEGKLQTRSYEDKNGVTLYSTEIIVNEFKFLDKKESGDSAQF